MSSTDRQNRLLAAEDWKRIYQSFTKADFQSYDFENLRRVMITYIRENYPEDYNDYIESSEYLALVDLIAFLGQSISFRTDLNARENFLELAERRESVLRFARLLSYNAKRNIAGSGLLKFTTVQTSQNVYDSTGRNLAGQVISWNDPANPNWYDQFIKVINAALPATRQFGSPDDKATIYGIPTEQYRFQSANITVPVYSFSKGVDGRNMDFEIVSTTFKDAEEIYEEPPSLANRLAFIYRNDGKGTGSANTGFFLHFKQGVLSQGTFNIEQPSTSETVDINAVNINDTDVWLYRLDPRGLETELWAQVPALEGNNIIYNSLSKSIKNIYSVVSRNNDQVTLMFADGTFGNLPRGNFRVYYRASNGISYTINPRDIRNVSIEIPYISNIGQSEVLTVTMNLQTTVANASPTETNASIKSRAPATYYTQNRMITGEDYNIAPLSVSQEVVKVKAVNRSASGISRYFDLSDPSGKYSKTNLFADDGALYKEEYIDSFRFSYMTKTDIEAMIYNQLTEKLKSVGLRDYYYSKFFKILTDSVNAVWINTTSDTNMSTGYIGSSVNSEVIYKLGVYTNNNLKFIVPGSLVKFIAPAGYYFDKADNNRLVLGNDTSANSSKVIWTKIVKVTGDGTGNQTGLLADGTSPVILNEIVPSGAILSQVIPVWRTTITSEVITAMIDLVFSNKPFGLRYDIDTTSWKIVYEANLDVVSGFSLGKQGNNTSSRLDASWLFLFTTDNEFYTVKYRSVRYIFESEKQIRFYYDSSDKIYDIKTNTVIKDKIKILNINTKPDDTIPFTYDRDWEISEEYKGLDGYVDTKKIQITFSDTDYDSIVDNPEIFEEIVGEVGTDNVQSKYIVLERYDIDQGQEDYRIIDNSSEIVIIKDKESSVVQSEFTDGQYFYFIDTGLVKKLAKSTGEFLLSTDYKLFVGRTGLKFQYIHNADHESRIDPGVTNLIDIFVLTKQYDTLYRQWLLGSSSVEPLPPSTDSLYILMSPTLNRIKALSDEIIYHPVRYKILFGNKATPDVQATFKVVKNSDIVISDNDVKSRVLSAINEFFNLENWDFGDSFYFSELTAYVMNRLAPNIVNFVIVPAQSDLNFGSLYEIRAEKDQIFINGATIDNIEIISAITASKIKSSGAISAKQSILDQQGITSSGNI